MTNEHIFICQTSDLTDRGKGIRFGVMIENQEATGFIIRYDNIVRAYLNRCAHVPIELDWNRGEFFESSKLYLMCATHGAIYLPENGQCIGGPCRGGRLRPIVVVEKDGRIFWQPDQYIKAIPIQAV